jgi:soluble lytic murein transglycosylase-like protein
MRRHRRWLGLVALLGLLAPALVALGSWAWAAPGAALAADARVVRVVPAAVLYAGAQAQAHHHEVTALSKFLAGTYRQPQYAVHGIVKEAFEQGRQTGVPPLLLLAMMRAESSLRPAAVSGYGAMGLLQVVPRHHRDKLARHGLREAHLLMPAHNILIGAEVLQEYLARARGDLDLALHRYSGGARNYAARVRALERELAALAPQAGGLTAALVS